MDNDFKINLFFSNDGENIEKLLSHYLIYLLKHS